MTLDVLSHRNIFNSPARSLLYEFEDIISKTCDARIISPAQNKLLNLQISNKTNFTRKFLNKTNLLYEKIDNYELADEENILFITCLNGNDLSILDSLPHWRLKYDIVCAYVCDSWMTEAFSSHKDEIDLFLVPFPEAQEITEEFLETDTYVIPLGMNILEFGSNNTERKYDLITFGRTSGEHVNQLKRIKELNILDINNEPQALSPQPKIQLGKDVVTKKRNLYNQLAISKLCLAFENTFFKNSDNNLYPAQRLNKPILTARWFEAAGSGCVIVGKKPKSILFDELLGWENSTIDLSGEPEKDIEEIKNILKRPDLNEMYENNYYHSLSLNDWRHRINDLFHLLDLPLPKQLEQEIELIYSIVEKKLPSTTYQDWKKKKE